MKVSDTRNDSIPDLALTTEELAITNASLNSAYYRRNFEILNIDAVLPSGETLSVDYQNTIMDLNIDLLTVPEIRKKLDKHFKLLFPEDDK